MKKQKDTTKNTIFEKKQIIRKEPIGETMLKGSNLDELLALRAKYEQFDDKNLTKSNQTLNPLKKTALNKNSDKFPRTFLVWMDAGVETALAIEKFAQYSLSKSAIKITEFTTARNLEVGIGVAMSFFTLGFLVTSNTVAFSFIGVLCAAATILCLLHLQAQSMKKIKSSAKKQLSEGVTTNTALSLLLKINEDE